MKKRNYYIRVGSFDQPYKKSVKGYQIDELTFIYYDRPKWIVTDTRSGLQICTAKNKDEALKLFVSLTEKIAHERSTKFYLNNFVEQDYLSKLQELVENL